MAEPLKAENFLPHVDKVFRVQGGSHALTLVKVEMQGLEAANSVPRQPFNLIFAGPPGNVLNEGLYRVEVEDGPHFELYVMPVHTPMPDRQNYQAAFN
ncbi:hypothetical protein SAMN05519104_1097 [Rhizobiales bacterium GAS188]|nr:hypothetical protein SAMN05519104_1097 [Rhizobiales bacterium GAS188]